MVEILFLEAVTDDVDDRFSLSLVLFLPSREDEDSISLIKAFCDDFLVFNEDEAVIIRDAVLEYCPEDTSNDGERLLFLLLLV